MTEPIPAPSAIAEVPPGFDAFWARATMRDPAERFQTARDLAAALDAVLRGGSTATLGAPTLVLEKAARLGSASTQGPVGGEQPLRPSTPLSQVLSSPEQPTSRRRRLWLALAGLWLLAGGGFVVAVLHHRAPSPRPASPASWLRPSRAAVRRPRQRRRDPARGSLRHSHRLRGRKLLCGRDRRRRRGWQARRCRCGPLCRVHQRAAQQGRWDVRSGHLVSRGRPPGGHRSPRPGRGRQARRGGREQWISSIGLCETLETAHSPRKWSTRISPRRRSPLET